MVTLHANSAWHRARLLGFTQPLRESKLHLAAADGSLVGSTGLLRAMSELAYELCEWRTEMRRRRRRRRRSLPHAQSLPSKDEGAKVSTDEDADDEITVVVHGQQHDKVRDSKLNHVYQCTDGLLEHAWAEGRHGGADGASHLAAVDGLESRLGSIG